jgi:hypothetical protein
MIKRYNRKQTSKTLFLGVGGIIICILTYLIFQYLPVFVASRFGAVLPDYLPVVIGIVGLSATFITSYRSWKTRGGLYSYHESALYYDLGDGSAGAFYTDYYAHRVTAPAYVLSEFLNNNSEQVKSSLTHSLSLNPTGVLPSHCDRATPEEHLNRLRSLENGA